MSVIGDMAAVAAQSDRIKELRAEIARLRTALKPFAEEAAMYEECDDGVRLFAIDEDGEKSEIDICVGDLRRAAQALK